MPLDQKLAAQAAKLGKPLAEVASAGKIGPLLGGLAARLIASVETSDATSSGGARSLLGKLGDFRAKLPGRKAKQQA